MRQPGCEQAATGGKEMRPSGAAKCVDTTLVAPGMSTYTGRIRHLCARSPASHPAMSTPSEFTYDVFLSYALDDRERVRRVAERLRAVGLRIWFDGGRPPDEYPQKHMDEALEQSRTLVLCLSPAALRSNWVALERSTILFRDPSNAGRRFIPVLLADSDVPDSLRRYQLIDLRVDSDAAYGELVLACQRQPDGIPIGVQPDQSRPDGSDAPSLPRSLAELERILPEQPGISALAVSPDSQWLACSSNDSVAVWNLVGGGSPKRKRMKRKGVRTLNFVPGSRLLMWGTQDAKAGVWNPDTERQVVSYNKHANAVVAVSALAENRACSISWDETIQIWNTRSGDAIQSLTAGKESNLFSGAVSPDGKWALAGEGNGSIRRWELETGDPFMMPQSHVGMIHVIVAAPDGRFAISGAADKTIKIWNVLEGRCIGTLEGHKSDVVALAISPGGTLMASIAAFAEPVRLWGWQSGQCLQVLDVGDGITPTAAAFTPDGLRLVVGTAEGRLYVYRLLQTAAPAPPSTERRYMNAKVVLVGESGVGKSALAHRLIEDRFVQTTSTHGMQVWRLDLPLEPEEDREREALLWDLAGQEDYRLIHQLFLEETALALLLFNPQADDPFSDVLIWLKTLRKAVARDMEKLLVAARIDVGNVKISQKKIDRFVEEHALAGYVATSALRGDSCSDAEAGDGKSVLKQLIARHIAWDGLPWTSTPRLLAVLKDAVLAMTEEKHIRMLRLSELVQRLEHSLPDEHFNESDVRTAVTLLANHGLVLPLKFGNLVLLQPALLNGYAAAVIRAARDHTDEIGSVSEQSVFDRTISLQGVDRLEAADEELLMRAIVQTFLDKALCIAEDTPEGRHLVFPSQYRRERPIPQHPEIFVSYSFSGEWQTVYSTLVVRLWYSREFRQKELWSNAAEFQTSKGCVAGLLMEHAGEGKASISVFFDIEVPDELKVTFIEYVHRHLERYAYDVRRDRRYVCQHCSKPVTDLPTVRERLDAGKDFITCQKCDHRVPLVDHIEQRLASDPVARKVLGMDQTATRELDTQALEQILTGHMMAICGEANQIFRELTKFDYGIDGEVEFKSNDGTASGKKIYVQLKSGASYLRTRKSDNKEVFDVKSPRHLEYWTNQPVDVYLVIRDAEETIRWMNITQYLKGRADKANRQIIFDGEVLDAPAVWRVRDRFFRH